MVGLRVKVQINFSNFENLASFKPPPSPRFTQMLLWVILDDLYYQCI